jgi:hypothetical protein
MTHDLDPYRHDDSTPEGRKHLVTISVDIELFATDYDEAEHLATCLVNGIKEVKNAEVVYSEQL